MKVHSGLVNGNFFNVNFISSAITFLLILLLVLGQIETTKDYHVKAEEFHTCGLELSSLYNALLIFKTLIEKQPLENKKQFTHKLSESYQRIVAMHDNHAPIDTEIFKSKASKYHNLNWLDVQLIKIKYYINTTFLFHLLIVFPPILLFILMKQ
ncbi:SLATT domain-containing protein [Flavobacterium sp. SM2513]|uniref:SLATT domain-containing protein n=1 Tax=Flavobacterium sp. SM2513 TaxID=3424766 RepID=UPI003D7FD55D